MRGKKGSGDMNDEEKKEDGGKKRWRDCKSQSVPATSLSFRRLND